jgi:ANTAR domain/GAF domain
VTGPAAARIWAQVAVQSLGAPLSLAHVCRAAVAALGIDCAAVSVVVGPSTRDTLHATDRLAAELEEWQLLYGQGPCVDAFAEGGPVLVSDLADPGYRNRWPVFTPAALGSGVRAIFSMPLQVGAIRLGILDLNRRGPGALGEQHLADALAFAAAAVTLLLDETARTRPETAELQWQGDDPTAHHVQVHQATGMVLAQLGVGADAAFARLRAYAYAHDRRLAEVAADVVARRLRFDPDPLPAEPGEDRP